MTRTSQALSGFFFVVAIASAGQAARHSAVASRAALKSTKTEGQVTFNHDIAPIVFRVCAQCHHPGEAGPFPLLTYADAKSHGRQIAFVTSKRAMPPWLPDAGELKFTDDLRLSEEEISTIQRWVDQGEIEGSPADLPAQPTFNAGWQLGKPDVIARAEKP
ncbi:MAG TPA: cytochrome c, partial [Chthoniobacterales bacterium]|nr:cytochrome c [Chthoniobacterales bacterium]